MALEKLLNLKEVASIIGWGKSRTHKAVATAEIPALIVSRGSRRRCFRVRPTELEKWLRAREVGR
jgi:hypothetical protein